MIVPFAAEHVTQIWPNPSELMMTMARFYERYDGFTAIKDGRAIGAAGIAVAVPGIGEAWSFLSDEIRTMPFMLHRRVKRAIPIIMRERNLRRVQAAVDPEHPVFALWIMRLGFRYEGMLQNFRDDKRPALLYARTA